MKPSADLTGFLDQHRIDYEVLPHTHTETARAEARALGIPPEECAKTVVVTNSHGFIRAVVPAWAHVDLAKIGRVLGLDQHVRLASEAELAAAYPAFELGAVPPIGGPGGDRTVVDRFLAERPTVVVEAGSHDASIRIKTRDLLRHARAAIGDICAD